ncbi:DUF4333 domain-containing protein [Prauserella alba]|uniref:DUF4333 domain-containing protein n=1 Tax=Prauserella alba TaxID=176898 RepID=A0ABN1VBS7_9PSEU|nr:DUF4333 domain-containing protein [Prauserella alba]MCP2179112.1 protein of unknown function (DUF4333) [Prauserella alba]
MSRLARVVLVPLACAALALTGCSFEFSVGSTVDKEELEKQVMGALSEQDRRPKDVTCPGDLEPEVDATTTCTATGQDDVEREAKVTVTEVGEDDRVQFDVVLDRGTEDGGSTAPDEPVAGESGRATDAPADDEIDRAVLARQAAQSLSREVGQHLGEVHCPEHVDAEVGASTRCVLTNPAGTRFGVTVDVTGLDAQSQDASFHVQVDAQPLSDSR